MSSQALAVSILTTFLSFSIVEGDGFSYTIHDSCIFDGRKTFCRVKTNVTAICRLQNISILPKLLVGKMDIKGLDLSNNCIQSIPALSFTGLRGLSALSLAFNKITVLKYQVFAGLDSLEVLNLSMNPLHSLTGDIKGVFGSLSLLDVSGVVNWRPERQLLRLATLSYVVGLTHSKDCTNCSFYIPHQNNFRDKISKIVNRTRGCTRYTYSLDRLPGIPGVLKNTMFSFTCQNRLKCVTSKVFIARNTIIYKENFCWKESLLLLKAQGCLGLIAFISNLIVFLNVLSSKSLRGNPCMVLVCNMALSDFLLGIYTISISAYLSSYSYNYLSMNSRKNCWKIGVTWMFAQANSVVTAFYLTLERHLTIVFALRPHVRITCSVACVLLLFGWGFSICLTCFALKYNFYAHSFLCMPISSNLLSIRTFTVVVGTIGILAYLASFLLYIHIYIIVKCAEQNAGVRRESRIAKRIGALVFSNVFFFLFPLLITGGIALFSQEYLTTVSLVITSMSLTLNSFLNPFIHAFRNNRFKTALKKNLQHLLAYISSWASRMPFRVKVTPVNQVTL
ncbi:G-protein coupled receptor GRL101-like [Exaiptasia diaphana]|uniref:G-protein coupled receptors family 1 profile domain-containing protein n=1 Tax=Exaiptasia diaphana TaxID=2652724 RepID=A0A913YKR7_EXADI|nr:G-protein coupled receptor GRL101-like [Exaiptasia diaphana]